MQFHVYSFFAVLLSVQVHLSLQGNRAAERIVIQAGLGRDHDVVGFKLPFHVAPPQETSQQARAIHRVPKPVLIRPPVAGRVASRGRRPLRPRQSKVQVFLPTIRAEIPHHIVHEPPYVHLDHIDTPLIQEGHHAGIELVRVAAAPVRPVYRPATFTGQIAPDKTIIITLTDGGAAPELVALTPAVIPADHHHHHNPHHHIVKAVDVATDSAEDNC